MSREKYLVIQDLHDSYIRYNPKKNLDPSWLIVTSDNLYITSSTLPLLCGLDQAQTGVSMYFLMLNSALSLAKSGLTTP